jgi:hypothetical protein
MLACSRVVPNCSIRCATTTAVVRLQVPVRQVAMTLTAECTLKCLPHQLMALVSPAGLRMSHLQTALLLLYPFKSQQQLADIAACLEAACCYSSSSSSSTGASSTRGASAGGSVIQPQGLAAVIQAVRQAANSIGCSVMQQPDAAA